VTSLIFYPESPSGKGLNRRREGGDRHGRGKPILSRRQDGPIFHLRSPQFTEISERGGDWSMKGRIPKALDIAPAKTRDRDLARGIQRAIPWLCIRNGELGREKKEPLSSALGDARRKSGFYYNRKR